MKRVPLHPVSVLSGFCLACLVVALGSAQAHDNGIKIPHAPRPPGGIRVVGIPSPHEAILLQLSPVGPASYSVPPKSLLVITGLGSANPGAYIMIDDLVVWYSGALPNQGPEIPAPGIVAHEGSVVKIIGGAATAYLLRHPRSGGPPLIQDPADPDPAQPLELEVSGIPDPREALLLCKQYPDDQGYTVPAGKALVITGLGANTNGSTLLQINGSLAWRNTSPGGYQIPAPGVVAHEGSFVQVIGPDYGTAIGYLIDE